MTSKFIAPKHDNVSLPLPLDRAKQSSEETVHRIWIGNVDPLVNEFTLLQLLKKFGKLKEFDFLFHKTGPMQGKSRGFHFATFFNKNDAENAIEHLNKTRLLSKQIFAHWADEEETKEKLATPNLNLMTDLVAKNSISMKGTKSSSKMKVIKSIEQKLKEMENPGGSSSSSHGLHPLLQKAKENEAEAEKRRMHPYHRYKKKL